MALPGTTTYTGLHRHSLDDKDRLTVPSPWRSMHAEGAVFMAVPNANGYITLLPPEAVARLDANMDKMDKVDADTDDALARFYALAQSLTFDKQGRFILSADLRAYAGIGREAVLSGYRNKINIYSPERWARVEQRTEGPNLGPMIARLPFSF